MKQMEKEKKMAVGEKRRRRGWGRETANCPSGIVSSFALNLKK